MIEDRNCKNEVDQKINSNKLLIIRNIDESCHSHDPNGS